MERYARLDCGVAAVARSASLDRMTLVRPTCQKQANQFFHGRARNSECSQLDQDERGSRFRWAPEHVLALGTLISLGYREKRQQADSSDASLTSTPTTTISTPAGRAFLLPSRSSVQSLLHATIFPSSETVHHTSVRMRCMRTPIDHCGIGQRRPKHRALVANRALGRGRGSQSDGIVCAAHRTIY